MRDSWLKGVPVMNVTEVLKDIPQFPRDNRPVDKSGIVERKLNNGDRGIPTKTTANKISWKGLEV